MKDGRARYAIHQELSSNPATLEASTARDVHGLVRGNSSEQEDGERACARAALGGANGGVKTWAWLPRVRWRTEFHNYADPVAPVEKAIYGHPDVGGHWEECFETATLKEQWARFPAGPHDVGTLS